jgi:hypothetical protein
MISPEILFIVGMTYAVALKVTCFILGYLVIKIGASLLREGIKGEFKFSADISGLKGDLASASPGLLFLVVGGILIGIAMSVEKPARYVSGGMAPAVHAVPDVPLPSEEELRNVQ